MHILIVGAGYAGLRLALDLDERLRGRPDLAEVTLIDQNPYHQLVQLLHLTATGGLHSRETVIDLEQILKRRKIRMHQGRVTRIVPLDRQVILADGQTVSYDRLVLALGATNNYNDVPGAREHTLSLRTYDEALQLRNHFVARVAEAARTTDPTAKRILMTCAIVGGGYTGCQLAGELAVWLPALCEEYGVPRSEVRIAIVERNALLLKQFGLWATREAERVLDRRGVSVYLETIVERIEPQALYVNGNRVLRAATIVWAGGIRGPALMAEAGLPTDAAGRVLVDRYLRVRDQALIFAIGDCANVPDGQNGSVPATASYAMRQGDHLAETLLAEIEGVAPRAYEPLKLGEVVSLGPDEAVGDPLGVPVTGLPATLLKKGIEVWYRSTLE